MMARSDRLEPAPEVRCAFLHATMGDAPDGRAEYVSYAPDIVGALYRLRLVILCGSATISNHDRCNARAKARSSCVNSAGSSSEAKWPPRSSSFQ